MKVSVVIPAYNEEKYIGKCIETLINQSYRDFEIIIIDDGSKDKTVDIVKKFIKKNKNIKLFYQQHGGPGRARNLGVKNSRGEIIVLVDADMEFEKDYVKNLVEPIVKKKAIGTYHIKEYAANTDNIWARCWGTKRVDDTPGKTQPIFRAILKKDFLKVGGFDPAKGTFDDQSLAKKLGRDAVGVDAICHHNNPTTLSETFHHMKWIGGSFVTNPEGIKRHVKKFILFIAPIAIILLALLIYLGMEFGALYSIFLIAASPLLLALLLATNRLARNQEMKIVFALPVFYFVEIMGFLTGIIKQSFFAVISTIKKEKITYKY